MPATKYQATNTPRHAKFCYSELSSSSSSPDSTKEKEYQAVFSNKAIFLVLHFILILYDEGMMYGTNVTMMYPANGDCQKPNADNAVYLF
jgi:hypothetical protein